MDTADKDRSEIAFFDVETTVPIRSGQRFAILEFGAILVCPKKLEELESYSTLVRPSSLSLLNALSIRCNGITRDAVVSAPTFADIADKIFDLLQGKIWAGHNILRFDCVRIREAFLEIGRPVPEPKGVIDSLSLLTQKFGRRAGDMKMATLATYFGLGKQVHRSLDDVRMNLEVLKYCATVLFLESSLPDIFTEKSWVSPNATTRSRINGGNSSPVTLKLNKNSPLQSLKYEICEASSFPSSDQTIEKKDINTSSSFPSTGNIGDTILNLVETNTAEVAIDPFNMGALRGEIPTTESLIPETRTPEECGECLEGVFLEPEEVLISSINASLVPFYRGSRRIRVFHKNVWLQLFCGSLQVRWGLSSRFTDHAGRPRLSFVVDAHQSLCNVLNVCDDVASRLSVEGGSSSEWRPTVIRKNGFPNSPTIRISIPIATKDVCSYSTEFYKKKPCGGMQKLVFNGVVPTDIYSLLVPGTFVGAYFSLEPYDFQLNSGIRLVAKKLIV